MKKVMFSMMVAVAAAAVWAKNDPVAPYDGYGPAMKSTPEKPLTSVWQQEKRTAIDAATSDAVLAAFVADAASAKALLAKLEGAFTTDPLTLTQISSVSQWVMLPDAWYDVFRFWAATHADGRKVWVKALLDTAETSSDAYVKTLCLDQLRWCGCDCPVVVSRIRAIGEKSGDKDLRQMAELAAASVAAK